jgi:uracil-DNA glycosylase family 4
LAVLRTNIDEVGFVEAVRCRPDRSGPWRPGDPVRRRCRPFLEKHLLVTEPRLVLPLGLVAAASCLEVAFGETPATLEQVVGRAWGWLAPWGTCLILPLYHPSPANGARWRRNRTFLRRFLKQNPDAVVRSVSGTDPGS